MIVLVSDVDFTFNFHLFPGQHLKFTLCTTPAPPLSSPWRWREASLSTASLGFFLEPLRLVSRFVIDSEFKPNNCLSSPHHGHRWALWRSSRTTKWWRQSFKNRKQFAQLLITSQNCQNIHRISNDRPLETERVIVTSLRRSSGRYQINAMFFFKQKTDKNKSRLFICSGKVF